MEDASGAAWDVLPSKALATRLSSPADIATGLALDAAGKQSHQLLRSKYLNNTPAGQRPYVDVDRAFTDLAGNRFRPDAVNHWTGEVVEFKPSSWQGVDYLAGRANEQVFGYVDRLTQLYGDWRALQGLPEYWGYVEYY